MTHPREILPALLLASSSFLSVPALSQTCTYFGTTSVHQANSPGNLFWIQNVPSNQLYCCTWFQLLRIGTTAPSILLPPLACPVYAGQAICVLNGSLVAVTGAGVGVTLPIPAGFSGLVVQVQSVGWRNNSLCVQACAIKTVTLT